MALQRFHILWILVQSTMAEQLLSAFYPVWIYWWWKTQAHYLIEAEWRIYASVTSRHWFRQWLGAWPAPSHYLNQCWNIVNLTVRNSHWNLNRNSYIFFHENAFENVAWEMATILSRPQCVKWASINCELVLWLYSWLVLIFHCPFCRWWSEDGEGASPADIGAGLSMQKLQL